MTNAGFVLSPLIAAAMTLILIVLVFPAVYRDRSRRIFLFVLFSLELWAVFTFAMRFSQTTAAAMVWDRLITACVLCLFATFFHFCHLYMGRKSHAPMYLLYVGTAVAAGIGLFTDLVVRGVTRFEIGYAPQVGSAAYVMFGATQVLLIANIARLLRARSHEVSIFVRKRLLSLAIAGLLPFFGTVADGFTKLPPMGIWTNLAFCTVCSFVILRYRLFDLRALARKGLIRLLVGSMIAIPYIGAILVANALLHDRGSLLWIYVVAMFVYALVMWPAYEWARRHVDRLLNSERYEHLQALRDLARSADAFSGSHENSSRLTALVQRALNASSVALLQPPSDGRGMCLVASNGKPCDPEEVIVSEASPLVQWFHKEQAALSIRTLSVEPLLQNIPEAERAALNKLRADLLSPLLTAHGALSGILVLGPKASRRQYLPDDIELLETLGGEAAMALENARLYRDAVRARETLEEWLNNLPDAVAIVGRDDIIRFLNREGINRIGARPGQRLFLLAGPPGEDAVPRRFTETIRGREYEIASAPLVEPGGQLSSVFVMRDITERKKEQAERETASKAAEEQLKQAHTTMRNLATHLLHAREEERRKIAQEIHDELGQTLFALKMDLHWIAKRLGGDVASVRDKVKGTIELGEQAIATVQRVASDLRPKMLDDLGLEPALQWLGVDFTRRTKIACKVSANVPPRVIGGNAATTLYRVIQEALTNIGRHSNAGYAIVRLIVSDGAVILQVEDDGVGITEEQATAPNSYGLIGIRERLEQLGGSMSISGEPGFGTILVARIPLPAEGGLA